MDTISGIPAHPLFVHLPVVLLPLAAVGALILLIKTSWYERYKWVVLGLAGLGALGGILAASSGEGLEETMSGEDRRLIESHTEMGDTARLMGIIFFLVVLAWVLVPIFLKRRAAASTAKPVEGETSPASGSSVPKWVRPVLAALVVVTAAASVVTVIDAGHSGAKRVWSEEGEDDGD